MKVAYVIGPIRSKWGIIGRLINVWRGRQAAAKLWKAGFAVICPHLNSFTIAMAIPDEDKIVECDLEIVSRCDFAVTCGRCYTSAGARAEIDHCRKIEKRIYWGVDEALRGEMYYPSKRFNEKG